MRRKKMKNNNPYTDEEFINPNRNFEVLMMELRDRIEKIRLDIIHINDPELKGIAENLYIDLKIKYFKLMRDDLHLQKMFEGDEHGEEE